MKNIFDYAKKELSQDAFLMWLLESYNEDGIKEAARKLLKEFCKIDENAEIKSLVTVAQYVHTDVKAEIVMGNGEKICLYIEDKVFSKTHDNQLEVYNGKIEPDAKKVYYKTSIITDEEQAEVEQAGWEIYDINKICRIFEGINSDNLILMSYIEHINKLKQDFSANDIPKEHNSKKDLPKWAGFFNNCMAFDSVRENFSYEIGYYISYIYMKIKEKGKEEVPHIELNSSKFKDNKFEFILLWSDAKDEDKKIKGAAVNRKIQQEGYFTQRKNSTQQLGKKQITFKDKEDLCRQFDECLIKYKEIMDIWNGAKA